VRTGISRLDGARSDDRSAARELAWVASKIGELDEERRQMIDQ
jgi:hypothetical protein